MLAPNFGDNAIYTASAVTLTANANFAARDIPDLVLIDNATTILALQLPKIGSAFAPVGKRVSFRKQTAGGTSTVTLTTHADDTFNGSGTTNATALPSGAKNTVTIQATSATNWDIVASSVASI